MFDGFFPLVPADAEPQRGGRAGLHEMGLPYVSDPAITRHLAEFLKQQGQGKKEPLAAILFNGGVFTPPALRERVLEVMRNWYDRPGSLAAAGADQSVAGPGRRLGGGLLRLAAAHRRQAHRRRHRTFLLRRHRYGRQRCGLRDRSWSTAFRRSSRRPPEGGTPTSSTGRR